MASPADDRSNEVTSEFVQALRRLITGRNENQKRLLQEARSLSLGVEERVRRLHDSALAEPSNEPDDRDLASILRSACELLDDIEEHNGGCETEDQPDQILRRAYELALELRVSASKLAGLSADQTVTEKNDLISSLESARRLLGRSVNEQPQVPIPSSDDDASALAKEVIRIRDLVLQAKLSGRGVGPDWLDGLYAKLGKVLTDNGIVEIDDYGRFDHDRQRVLEVRTTRDPEQDEVVHSTVRPGYLMGGTVLRPQEVIIYVHDY